MRRLSFEAKDLECIVGAMSVKAVQRSLYAHPNSSNAHTMPTFVDLSGLLRRRCHNPQFCGCTLLPAGHALLMDASWAAILHSLSSFPRFVCREGLVISAASKQDLEGAGKLLLGSIARGVGARFRAKQLWSRRCDGPIVGVGLVAGAALSRSFTARGGKKNLVFIATRGGESYDALVRLRDPRQGEAPRFVFHRQTVQSSRQ